MLCISLAVYIAWCEGGRLGSVGLRLAMCAIQLCVGLRDEFGLRFGWCFGYRTLARALHLDYSVGRN